MRIALVVQGGVDRSGQERVVPALLWLIERLARRHEVHVFALRHERRACRYDLVGARVHDLGGGGLGTAVGLLRLGPRLWLSMRRLGPFGVVHAYRGGLPGLLAAVAARGLGVPLVLTLDGGELVALPDIGYGLQLRWRDRTMLACATRTAGAITVGSGYMRRLAEGHGLAVHEVPFGVDLRSFGPGEPPPGPPWRLLHVAHLNPVKDQATLLRAFRGVIDAGARAHLDIVGLDTLGSETQALAGALGVGERVTFHGLRRLAEIPSFYERSHLLIQSSRHDAAPVAVLEAAACRVPTVGTAVGYVADWAGDRAVATPVGDAGALAGAILALLGDDARRRTLGDRARSWAVEHDADWTAARLEALYEAVGGGGRSAMAELT